MPSAFSARWRSLTALTAQPTTNRENRSRIAARYTLPLSPITNSVVSPTQRRFGAFGRELPIEQIRGDRLVVIAHRGAPEAFPRPGFQAVLLHQPDHPLPTDPLFLLDQILVDPRAAIPLLTRGKRRAHKHAQLPIALSVGRFGSPAPGVIAARRDTQDLTHRRNRKHRLPRVNQRKRVAGSFAKKAAAFFRISRSSRSWRLSFRSRASSSRSAVVNPVRPCERSARARVTHARSAVSVKSRSRATAPTLLPSSRTSRTAWALKSSSNRRRDRRLLVVSAIGVDIVSAFRKVSTKPDQAHTAWLSRAASRERHADTRSMLVMPRRFDQQPADQRVPRPRDATAPMLLARGVLTRDETEIRHQRAGRVEPPKVMQLCQDQNRRQRIDPTEAPQPRHGFAIRLALRDVGQPRIEFGEPRLELIDRQQIIVDDDALRRLRPLQTVDPSAMRARPVATAVIQAATQQQLAQAMPTPLQIFTRVITRPTQIADRLLFRRRRPDLRQQPSAQQLHQFARIAAIGLHPLAGLPRNEPRRDDLTADTRCGDLALQRIAARPGFVTHPHGTRRVALELSHQSPHGVWLIRHLPRHRRRLVTNQHRDKEILLVRVHPNVRGNVFHDRLLSSAALTPRGVNPRSRWLTPPCRVRQHYDVTIASRSFHIVYVRGGRFIVSSSPEVLRCESGG